MAHFGHCRIRLPAGYSGKNQDLTLAAQSQRIQWGYLAIDLERGAGIYHDGRTHRIKWVQRYRGQEIASNVDAATLPSGCVVE